MMDLSLEEFTFRRAWFCTFGWVYWIEFIPTETEGKLCDWQNQLCGGITKWSYRMGAIVVLARPRNVLMTLSCTAQLYDYNHLLSGQGLNYISDPFGSIVKSIQTKKSTGVFYLMQCVESWIPHVVRFKIPAILTYSIRFPYEHTIVLCTEFYVSYFNFL